MKGIEVDQAKYSEENIVKMIKPDKMVSQDLNDRSEIIYDIPKPSKQAKQEANLNLKWGVTMKDQDGQKLLESTVIPATSMRMTR